MAGLIARVLGLERVNRNGADFSETKVDPGAGAVFVGEHFQSPGDDGNPLPNDYAVSVPVQGAGRSVIVGYIDPNNPGTAQPGERRVYSRDSAGTVTSSIWLKTDGTIEIVGNGDITINGVTINTSGEITATRVSAPSIVADGKELANHTHPYSWTDGPGSGNTGGNN